MISKNEKPTLIKKGAPYVTEINFFHTEPVDQPEAAKVVLNAAAALTQQNGFVAVNVLLSTDQARICTYIQWADVKSLHEAKTNVDLLWDDGFTKLLLDDSGVPRLYDIVYTDDRSAEKVSVISKDYNGTIFINEITTLPGNRQDRLLELVIDNNINQSLNTPGYRSANFHKSRDGYRAVNYSLWDTEEHLIQAISEMADQDINLEETMEIASPDFRFYTLEFAAHI